MHSTMELRASASPPLASRDSKLVDDSALHKTDLCCQLLFKSLYIRVVLCH